MLKRIQAKPKHIKKRISFALTLAIFSGIVFVWLSSWNARTTSDDSREKTASPTESFREVFAGIISDAKSKILMNTSFYEEREESVETSATVLWQATSTSTAFDMSGVVIIDLATSTASKEAR